MVLGLVKRPLVAMFVRLSGIHNFCGGQICGSIGTEGEHVVWPKIRMGVEFTSAFLIFVFQLYFQDFAILLPIYVHTFFFLS